MTYSSAIRLIGKLDDRPASCYKFTCLKLYVKGNATFTGPEGDSCTDAVVHFTSMCCTETRKVSTLTAMDHHALKRNC